MFILHVDSVNRINIIVGEAGGGMKKGEARLWGEPYLSIVFIEQVLNTLTSITHLCVLEAAFNTLLWGNTPRVWC